MKQKIKVDILKHGSENQYLLKAVARMNEGLCSFSIRDLEGYFAVENAKYNNKLVLISEEGYCHVSEDGGDTFTLTLEWVEVHELVES